MSTAPDIQRYIAHIARHGERTALLHADARQSYAKLISRISAFQVEWRGRVASSDVVALLSDYSLDGIAAFFALASLGAVVVPIATGAADEVAERLKVAGPHSTLRARADGGIEWMDGGGVPTAHAIIKQLRERGHAGLILFSSGSTGEPKAMLHDLDNLAASYLGRKPKDLTILVFLMFDHIGGLNTLLHGLSIGARLVLADSRDPDVVGRLIETCRVNILPASPTFLNLVLLSGAHERHDMTSVKLITYGTEAMPESLLERVRAAFPGARLLQTFGTSETGIVQTTSKSSASTHLRIDDPDTEVRIVKGELWLRSKTQVLGYLNASMECFTEDGWFRTGDLVEATGDGYIRIVGRKSDVINVGGEKVLPGEIESVILQMEAVVDCTVRGEPNAITGQAVAADIVVKPGFDAEKIRRQVRFFCSDRLDRYKIPAKVRVVPSIAHNRRFKKVRGGKGAVSP